MTKNPIINALSAALYIAIVVSGIYFGPMVFQPEETMLIPIAMLSLFCLSAATMAFIFFYQPITMYLDGEKKAAVRLIIHTITAFAGATILLFASLFLQVFV